MHKWNQMAKWQYKAACDWSAKIHHAREKKNSWSVSEEWNQLEFMGKFRMEGLLTMDDALPCRDVELC